jgi:hypothetical protein
MGYMGEGGRAELPSHVADLQVLAGQYRQDLIDLLDTVMISAVRYKSDISSRGGHPVVEPRKYELHHRRTQHALYNRYTQHVEARGNRCRPLNHEFGNTSFDVGQVGHLPLRRVTPDEHIRQNQYAPGQLYGPLPSLSSDVGRSERSENRRTGCFCLCTEWAA